MNSVDLAAKIVQIVVAFCAFVSFVFVVGKTWATITATLSTLKRLHERLEDFEKQLIDSDKEHAKDIADLRIDLARIQTALGLKKPTLRIPTPPAPAGPEVPMFSDGEGE